MNKTTSFGFYLVFYAALACFLPYMVLYYRSLGFTGAQIGLLAGASPLISWLSAPLWTGLADTTRRHRLIMSLTIGGAVALALLLANLKALGAVILVVALYYSCAAPIVSLADSATMFMLGDERDQYGRLRLGGTIGFGLAAPIVGRLVENGGLRVAFHSYAALMVLALIISRRLKFGVATADGSWRRGARTLLTNRRWLVFLALAFVGGMGFASINTYLYPYLQTLNASTTTMGLAVTLSTLSELPVFFFADRLLRRFKAFGLLVLALSITGIRLLLCAAFPSPVGVLLFQPLNGVTFPAAWAAGVSYADEHAPAGMKATAQGLFSSMIFGFGAAAGGFLGGLLLDRAGGRGLYLIFGVWVLASTALITLVARRGPANN